MSKYTQLVVWPGTVVGKKKIKEFEDWLKDEGFRVKYEAEFLTLPDQNGSGLVKGTGNRNDLLFFIHSEDVPKFAVWRLSYGFRWWEDYMANNSCSIVPTAIIERYGEDNWKINPDPDLLDG